jgi:hypothetical protein
MGTLTAEISVAIGPHNYQVAAALEESVVLAESVALVVLVESAALVGPAASAAATGRRSFPQTLAAAIGNTIPSIVAALPIGTAVLQIGSAAQLVATR